jgi:epsilon-lactone hydrolase
MILRHSLLLIASIMLLNSATASADSPHLRPGAAHVSCAVTAATCGRSAMPMTVSPEAQRALSNAPALPASATLEQRRRFINDYQVTFSKIQMRKYPVVTERGMRAGVPVRTIRPMVPQESQADRILIDLHGGGFEVDSGSLTENVAIAALTHTTVIAVLYRLAPEHPFPAAVDDAVAVYKDILRTHDPSRIGLYGTSAGAILTAETVMRLRQLALPLPAALGFFSGSADLSRAGDSEFHFPLPGDGRTLPEIISSYVGSHDPKDHMMSPLHGNLVGLPPTLCITSTRDLLLSQTVLFHRALLRADVKAKLVVFEAMPHAFWSYLDTPESDEAFQTMADFFLTQIN